jgi:cell division protein FtsB
MRVFAAILAGVLVLLQYRLWMSDQGRREVVRLQAAIAVQLAANAAQTERNRELAAEVDDLKVGMTAIEERARSELGMVGANETFYQVVTPATPPVPAPATSVSASTR